MPDHLQELLKRARAVAPTAEQEERQRLSFVYGTLKIEDGGVTRDGVTNVSEEMKRQESAPAEVRPTAGDGAAIPNSS